jgi:hypothetical protein
MGCTLSADKTTSVLEVLEEEGRRVVMEVDQRSQGHCAVEAEAHEPG